MKKVRLMTMGVLFVASGLAVAQELEKEITQELSKDARKGELVNFRYDPEVRDFTLLFKREKGKNVIYEVYQFDYDLKLVNNETLEPGTVSSRYPQALAITEAPAEKWHNPKVVRVDPGITGQIVLRQGILTREWAKTVEEKGSYVYTTRYWKYNFEEQQRITPKFEGLVPLPEGAPDWVIKMAQKSGEKLTQLACATDEPTKEVTTGRRNFVYTSLYARQHDYTTASGDILIVGRSDQMDFKTKEPRQVFLLLKYSAEDLSRKHYESFTLDFMQDVAFKQVLTDGSMVLIFCPMGGPGMKNKDPNPSNYTYVRVSKDATLLDKIPFESKGGLWVVQQAVLSANNEVLLYGAAVAKKKDKYFNMAGGTTQPGYDNLQVAKFANGTVSYLTSVDLAGLKTGLKVPANQKKADSYAGKDLGFEGTHLWTTRGDFLFAGQLSDRSAVIGFHFGADGAFRGQYLIKTEKQSKDHPIDYALFENPDQQTATFFLGELTGVDKGRELKYPRMARIDLAAATISTVETYGFGKKGEFFLDDIYPFTFIDDGAKVVFFSRDSKDSQVWLGRVKLGL